MKATKIEKIKAQADHIINMQQFSDMIQIGSLPYRIAIKNIEYNGFYTFTLADEKYFVQ